MSKLLNSFSHNDAGALTAERGFIFAVFVGSFVIGALQFYRIIT